MKKICMLGLVFSFCFLFVFSACAAVITPGQESVKKTVDLPDETAKEIPQTKVPVPCVVMNDGSVVDIRLAKYESTKTLPTPSGIGGFTTYWEIRLMDEDLQGGRAKIVLPYPDGMTQSSAQGRFITILHVINSAANEYEIFSNDGTIANRKPVNLIPAGIEIEVSSFSPFYMKTSTKPENPMNVPQTGDKGLSLGIWVICLSAAFAGLMIFRNRKNKK